MAQQPKDGAYPGGKGLDGLYQWIIAKMPTHAYYVEPFAGRGAILRRKAPALCALAIDRDPSVIAWWQSFAWPGTNALLGDGIHWLHCNGDFLDEDCLVYADPPYLPSTRVKQSLFEFELSQAGHVRLLRVLMGLSCNVMLSGYESQLYRDELSRWHFFSRPTLTRGLTWRNECLWTNFDPAAKTPALAPSYERLGGTFRERERVKRKLNRWQRKLTQLPETERRALLLALIDAWQPRMRADDGARSGGSPIAAVGDVDGGTAGTDGLLEHR